MHEELRSRTYAIRINLASPDDYDIRQQLDELIHKSARDYEERLRADLESKLHSMLQDAGHHGERGFIEARFRINHRIREPRHAPHNFPNPYRGERESERIRGRYPYQGERIQRDFSNRSIYARDYPGRNPWE